jgi:hypothetical protein
MRKILSRSRSVLLINNVIFVENKDNHEGDFLNIGIVCSLRDNIKEKFQQITTWDHVWLNIRAIFVF